jgi:CRISPR system Cascade subunit CasB
LLNSDEEELPHHLRGIVSLLRSAKAPIPVDWSQLTWDLRFWSHPERRVQRDWARSFWGGERATEPTTEQGLDQTDE